MAELTTVRNASPVLHAILALILLVIATVLGVYKPFGMTPYGTRKQHEQRQALPRHASEQAVTAAAVDSSTTWIYVGIIATAIMLLFVLMHLIGNSFSH